MVKRTNQIDRTRAAILDAASDMAFGSTRPEDFTMQNIADKAGVSHRTLYRYFESRKALINAVGAEYDKRLDSPVGNEILKSFENWTSNARGVIGFGATHVDLFKKTLAFSVTTGEWRSDRDDAYWEMFRSTFPNLGESEARQDFAVLRHVLWSSNAVLIAERFDLSVADVAAGVERAVEVLVDGIGKRDEAERTRREGS
ncbi:MAG: TetR/AcrR family transcriptional regulator [Acidimicrobiia bacterium]